MEFHGNIGAEIPCITSAGKSVRETVEFAPLVFRPQGRRFSPAYNFLKPRHRLFRIITGHGGDISRRTWIEPEPCGSKRDSLGCASAIDSNGRTILTDGPGR